MCVGAAGELNDLQPDILTAHVWICWLYRTQNCADSSRSFILSHWLKAVYLSPTLTHLSGALAKLRKASISFVTSVRPSVRPSVRMVQLNSTPTGRIFMKFGIWHGSHWTDFHEIWYLARFLLDGFSWNLVFDFVPTGRIFMKFGIWLGSHWRFFMKFGIWLGSTNGFTWNLVFDLVPTWRIFFKFGIWLGSHWTDFHEIWYLTRFPLDGFSWNLVFDSVPTARIFMKFGIWVFWENLSRRIQILSKSGKNNRYFTWSPIYIFYHIHFLSYLAHFFLEWEMFQIKVVEKIKTHILCSVTFLQKSCRLWDKVEKYNGVGQNTDNMAHAHWMFDTLGSRHTFTICNTHCLSSTTMVTRTRLIVTLHVNCLSCSTLLFHLPFQYWTN